MTNAPTLDERLHALLRDGDFGSSGRLPSERDMAEQLGVSRPALREALRKLAELGVVDVRRGAGAFIAPVYLAELADVRSELEPMAARLAARHRTDEQLGELGDALRELGEGIDDPPAFAAADARLHRLLAAASGNRVLARTLATLDELAAYSRATTVVDADLRRRTLRDLTTLVGHLAARRGEQAAEIMRRHLGEIGTTLTRDGTAPRRRP